MADLNAGATEYPGTIDTYTEETAGENTDYKPVNGGANAAVAIQGELGVNPAGTKATVVARLDQEHDSDGEHSYKVPFMFEENNTAANQTAVAIQLATTDAIVEVELPWAGSVIGISISSNASRSAGSAIVDATINGTVTGLQATLDGTNADHHSATQAKDTDSFSAGDLIGVKITTDASWAPNTADLVVVVFVSFNE